MEAQRSRMIPAVRARAAGTSGARVRPSARARATERRAGAGSGLAAGSEAVAITPSDPEQVPGTPAGARSRSPGLARRPKRNQGVVQPVVQDRPSQEARAERRQKNALAEMAG